MWCTSSLRERNESAVTLEAQQQHLQLLKPPSEQCYVVRAAESNAPHDPGNGCAKLHASEAATCAYQRGDILRAARGLAKLGLRRGRPLLLKQGAGLRDAARREARGTGHAEDAKSATGTSPHALRRTECGARSRAGRTTRSKSSDGSEVSSDESLFVFAATFILRLWRRVAGRSPRSTVSGALHAETSMRPFRRGSTVRARRGGARAQRLPELTAPTRRIRDSNVANHPKRARVRARSAR